MSTAFSDVPIRALNVDSAVAEMLSVATVTPSVGHAYRFVNAYSISLAQGSPAYRELLGSRGSNMPDGKPLTLVLKILNPNIRPEQVRGPTVFRRCLDEGRKHGVRHYFLGGSEDTLERLVEAASTRFPGITIVGAFSPPFRKMTQEEVRMQDEFIRGSGADLVWIGLGTPKQDFEGLRIADEVGVTTAAVGAAFDFLAGTRPEAPGWVSRIGFEWLFRLLSEPRRLWRRYLLGNANFLRIAVGELRRRRQ